MLLFASLTTLIIGLGLGGLISVKSQSETLYPLTELSRGVIWLSLGFFSVAVFYEVALVLRNRHSSWGTRFGYIGILLIGISALSIWLVQTDLPTRCLGGCSVPYLSEYLQTIAFFVYVLGLATLCLIVGVKSLLGKKGAPGK
jgi:hypothetical protein